MNRTTLLDYSMILTRRWKKNRMIPKIDTIVIHMRKITFQKPKTKTLRMTRKTPKMIDIMMKRNIVIKIDIETGKEIGSGIEIEIGNVTATGLGTEIRIKIVMTIIGPEMTTISPVRGREVGTGTERRGMMKIIIVQKLI